MFEFSERSIISFDPGNVELLTALHVATEIGGYSHNVPEISGVARSPSAAVHGSPGSSRAMTNTMKMMPMSAGMLTSNRRMMNWINPTGTSVRGRQAP